MTTTVAKKSSVLVVDDEEALRTVLSGELANEGYDVKAAADGDEAISEVEKSPFDLVLLDIKMPRMSGFEVHQGESRKDEGCHVDRFRRPEERHRIEETRRRRLCEQALRFGRPADDY
jgi:CheY-like chemotaxis protein